MNNLARKQNQTALSIPENYCAALQDCPYWIYLTTDTGTMKNNEKIVTFNEIFTPTKSNKTIWKIPYDLVSTQTNDLSTRHQLW